MNIATEPVSPRAILHPNARIGKNVTIGPYSEIHEHVTIGDDCVIGPHAIIAGHTSIGRGTRVGQGSFIGGALDEFASDTDGPVLRIGERNTFREQVRICGGSGGRATTIGRGNLIMAYAQVGPDCVIGDGVIITSHVQLGAGVIMEDRSRIGGLSTVAGGCRVGELAMIGHNSAVFHDVPPFVLVDGNPATAYGLNKVGLERYGMTQQAASALKCAYRMLFRAGQPLAEAIRQIDREIPHDREIDHLLEFLRGAARGIVH
ncbi:acyl-[acyl-carrier-protein]--UDP-N-acetylglucosamine O-acyltransferase [Hydrogenispora ethanolica]|jgi:UDP-N-acetylglucosamine acyltransferase|uniref:Acyl-[acyl-carrier-protein]--UDP-N-acetylglucosamine O-acyltransferase n=1 Tax=Hydrogenispora ethanolica TaxID=1082276 RepID=A0A4R1R048_HYDET|nr:acyl-ACP--UDP-N-acetylglucosamine O-acyltransferase [Hydrogenispora ethanolica]TCL58631.1 acyl-[acyl-carrier-protein]--UDP-N-acetylglucosamine O-acyltransferase [Hydrogenispora ethanolica]